MSPTEALNAAFAGALSSPPCEGPTCSCGGAIEGWTCQDCGAGFEEDSTGRLVPAALYASPVGRGAETPCNECAAVSRAIGTVRFMDPPDGGDVPLSEQVRRMRAALEKATPSLPAGDVVCIACGQPDEPELHDNARCPALATPVPQSVEVREALAGRLSNAAPCILGCYPKCEAGYENESCCVARRALAALNTSGDGEKGSGA